MSTPEEQAEIVPRSCGSAVSAGADDDRSIVDPETQRVAQQRAQALNEVRWTLDERAVVLVQRRHSEVGVVREARTRLSHQRPLTTTSSLHPEPPPVRTRNLGSSALWNPLPKSPLRRRGAQGVVWVKPSRLDPQSWSPGRARTEDTAVNIHSCRAGVEYL